MTDTALIAAVMPGLGDPRKLPIDVFDSMVRRVGFVSKVVAGTLDDRDLVHAEGVGFD